MKNTRLQPNGFALAITLALMSSNLYAETAEVEQLDAKVEKISVLGSRVSSRTATESAVPVDIISAESLSRGGFTELGQSLQASVPSFNFSRTQVSDGSDLFRPATLRGLQPDQTLVLINGKRRHNQAIFGLNGTVGAGAAGTDMNAIPLIALKDVQVLRDGAAAQYGSDAIAGVINLSLKDTTGETSGYLQGGTTGEGDGDNYSVGLNTGFDLGDDGGFINLSLEYRDDDGTNRAQPDIGGSPTIAPGTLSDEVRWGQGNAASEFQSVFYNAMMPVGEVELYSFGGYSNRTALGNGFWRNFNEASKNIAQVYPDGFLPRIYNEAQDISVAAGVRGDINDDWQFDVSGVYGQNRYDFDSRNSINASYAAEYLYNNPDASDADIAANSGPTSGYSGGFRFDQTTLNADINGFVDIGWDEPLYVAFGTEYRSENYEIVAGELASYSCGMSNADSAFPSVMDPDVFAGCGFQAYPGLRPDAAGKADRNSYAFYLDLETQLTDVWSLGTAARFEDFSDAGSDLVWKVSSRYEVTDDFALRGAVSTGFRAPSLQQSAYTAYTTNLGPGGVLSDSFTATAGSAFPSALGVESLDLETSENLSLGFVFNATEEISVTLDAYKVKIKDRITLGSLLTAEDVAFSPEAVAALNATGADQANYFSNSVNSTTQGLDLIVTYGTQMFAGDFNATLAGNLNETEIDSVNAAEGIPEDVALDDLQRSFLTDGQPKERATLTFDYSKNDWRGMIRANYFGETNVTYFGNDHIGLPDELSPTGSFLPTSIVEAAVLVDINIEYQFTESLSFSAGINNIFDVTPDELGANESLDFITNQAFKYPVRALPYGFDGTTYTAKVNFNF
ncbi:TonB-dependent receptor [Shewanella psychropiezotolerans]|uniref:TonB-dependent receptor n=1 Tax=Shewanella psychropiezotolerans TaxID=2593655 RepID=A0ABX5X1F1_9GAMM|nr:TonB-dependent receptor [Shewanella sp. YLB-07]MPY21953.1 TonB-dependent receptor [Shewanella sp. YLB-07]QDO85167.1 TonB-dependent receptor [Shewanella psychropiezotolerans]